MSENKNKVKKYTPGSNELLLYRDLKIRIRLLDIVEVDGVIRMAVYKWWNRYRRRWVYEGKKLSDILLWCYVVWELDEDERDRLFELNNIDYQQLTK